jgi:hypothetical protein
MTMYNAHITNQPVSDRKMVKKEIFDKVYIKIANSLAEFNLHGKKFEEQLKKVSKLFTKDITKASKKKKKQV